MAKRPAPTEFRPFATHGEAVYGLSCGPSGHVLAAGFSSGSRGAGQVGLWDRAGTSLGKFGPSAGVVCWYAELSPDGRTVAAGFGDLTLGLWDWKKRTTRFLPSPGGIIASLGWSADGRRLLTGNCADNAVRLRDAKGAELAAGQLKKSGTWFVALAPDGALGASGAGDKVVHLWDVAGGVELAALPGHTGRLLFVRFSPGGNRLVTASQDKTVRVWDVKKRRLAVTCQGHLRQVTCAVFFPDGERVASTSGDGTVRVWSAKTGRQLALVTLGDTKADAVAVTPEGVVLAGCDDASIRAYAV